VKNTERWRKWEDCGAGPKWIGGKREISTGPKECGIVPNIKKTEFADDITDDCSHGPRPERASEIWKGYLNFEEHSGSILRGAEGIDE
jgi:hypothetical protein